jgi:hypothetical protein
LWEAKNLPGRTLGFEAFNRQIPFGIPSFVHGVEGQESLFPSRGGSSMVFGVISPVQGGKIVPERP